MYFMSEAQVISQSFLDRWVFIWMTVFLAALTFSSALMEVASTSAIAGWALLRWKTRDAVEFDRKWFLPLLGFVGLSVISFVWSEYPPQSFRGIFKVLQQFSIFWIVAECFSSQFRLGWSFRILALSFVLLGIDGCWQYVFGMDLLRHIPFEPASAGPRISASFKNYGLTAAYVILFLPVLFSGFQKRWKGKWNLICAAGVTFGLFLLFWTRLRGAWVAFLVGLIFFFWVTHRRRIAVVLVTAAAVAILLLPRSMVIHLDAEGKEQSLVERAYLWDRALQVIAARPLTGTGINTYSVAHQKYDTRQNWRVRNYYSHNGYLQLAAETGLPSLALFLAFLYFYYRQGLAGVRSAEDPVQRDTLAGILAGLLNFLTLALIDTILHNPQSVMSFWFLAGWGTAYARRIEISRGVSSLKR